MAENLYVADSTGVVRSIRAIEGPGGALIQVALLMATSHRDTRNLPIDSVTPMTLAAERANRAKLIVFNDSTVDVRIKYGDNAALTDCTDVIEAGQTWEMPDPADDGVITALAEGPDATGVVYITEQWYA